MTARRTTWQRQQIVWRALWALERLAALESPLSTDHAALVELLPELRDYHRMLSRREMNQRRRARQPRQL